jgi:hypothetical protein
MTKIRFADLLRQFLVTSRCLDFWISLNFSSLVFSGIIDTRPLEQRTNFISFASLTNNVTSNFNLITINDTSSTTKEPSNGDSNKNSNTYLLKNNQLNNNFSNLNGSNHQRHMSVPALSGNNTPTKSLPTSSSTFQASIKQQSSNVQSPPNAEATAELNPLLYENVKLKSGGKLASLNNINNNGSNVSNVNVPYENINLEYINRLMKEGYSKESVVTALGISRNNFEMACDILHEFVSTNHQSSAGKVGENNR